VATDKPVLLPDIGDFSAVEIIEVLVRPGDRVAPEQSLLTLESDKATLEIPAPFGGTVREVRVKVGDKISKGDLLMFFETEDHDAPEPAPAAEGVTAQAASEPPASTLGEPTRGPRLPGEKEPQQAPVLPRPEDMVAIARGRKPHASPAVRRFARELGADLALVAGTGPKGRVLREDVQAFIKKALREGAPAPATGAFALPAAPAVNFSQWGEVETRPLSRIKKLAGAHLHRCWLTVPHVTQHDEADITELEAFRNAQKDALAKEGLRLTLMPFLLKACAGVLRALPQFNSSLAPDAESLILKRYVHIGFAVDTPNGLVVPVIRNVTSKGILELTREIGELSTKARDGKLLPADMQGGCFTISSLGGIGGTAFTPIVNAPEVAILGVSRSTTKPVWNGAEFIPRLVLPLSLSYDHRVIDGAEGARFTTLLCGLLGDIRRLLL
jgi:pyruvate dehydrogenase E2 component (dihydrolipoamide acetyltransferase)